MVLKNFDLIKTLFFNIMKLIIVLNQNIILILIKNNNFFKNNHVIRLNKMSFNVKASIEVKLVLKIEFNNNVYMN